MNEQISGNIMSNTYKYSLTKGMGSVTKKSRAGLEPSSLACGPASLCLQEIVTPSSVWPHDYVHGFPFDSNMEVCTGKLGPAGC